MPSHPSRRRALSAALAASLLTSLPVRLAAADGATDEEVVRHSRALLFGNATELGQAAAFFGKRGKPDATASLILALRYNSYAEPLLSAALREITGHDAAGWFDWMVWQERNPQIAPHPSFVHLKRELLAAIDPRFMHFLTDEAVAPGAMRIRLEEITWGGVRVDGIPSLDNPKLIAAGEADYLRDDDLVFGVAIDGDARAYPLRIMGWHEMFNETIGGVPLALAYCTLCGSGILYETRIEGRDDPLVFGSSGLLYRSNKLMFDRQTNSLWNQFTGQPVTGPLADSGIELKIRPVAITSWQRWRDRHPDSRVLSLDTGYSRDYGSGVVYRDYFASPNLMFPAAVDPQSALQQKDYVYGIRDVGLSKAWPLSAFVGGAVINDSIGRRPIVLIGDAETRTVRAYDREDLSFEVTDSADSVSGPGGLWQVTEEALIGPDGRRLPRLPGHIAYWFAWDGYLGVESELYDAANEG